MAPIWSGNRRNGPIQRRGTEAYARLCAMSGATSSEVRCASSAFGSPFQWERWTIQVPPPCGPAPVRTIRLEPMGDSAVTVRPYADGGGLASGKQPSEARSTCRRTTSFARVVGDFGRHLTEAAGQFQRRVRRVDRTGEQQVAGSRWPPRPPRFSSHGEVVSRHTRSSSKHPTVTDPAHDPVRRGLTDQHCHVAADNALSTPT
jgi:hypothetical protein